MNLPVAPPTLQGAIGAAPKAPTLEIASLVLGILSVMSTCLWCVGVPLGVGGIVCALCSKASSPLRTAGLICSIAGVVIGLGFLAFAIVAQVFSSP